MEKSVVGVDLTVVVADERNWELLFEQVKCEMPIKNMHKNVK